ncbi:MAG: DUF4167 domain-containing protein [Sphingomonadales bacterium]|nr:DUF4167 domain-containing protein [Sphingomonadales bacterium]
MNNNNNRNNRRRGRGNRTQGGNGAQLNRIDSRARGNAPQMLDKYKKLAQDAHHNGDRVQMEYYLQFADHYFRVIADNKARVDEQRGGAMNGRRNDERDQAEDYGDDDLDFDRGRRNEQPTRSRYEPQDSMPRSEMDEGEPGQEGESFLTDDRDDARGNARDDGRDNARDNDRGDQQSRPQNTRRQPRKPRDDNRPERAERTERPERVERAPRPERTERSERTERPERVDAARSEKPAPRARRPRKAADDGPAGLDSSILPPSIRGDDARDSSGDSDGTLEAVG